MPQRAHVTSVEAIEAFRTALLVFLSKARPALEEVSSDVLRVRLWVQNDQRAHWDREMKRRSRQLEDAQAALFSANMSNLRDVTAAEQAAVHRAKHAVADAEEKLRRVKLWDRDFENRTEPLLKQTEKLNSYLAVDVPNAIAYLTEAINKLADYADAHRPATLEPAQAGTSPAAEAPPDTAGDAGKETP
jgi:hypothetical protein